MFAQKSVFVANAPANDAWMVILLLNEFGGIATTFRRPVVHERRPDVEFGNDEHAFLVEVVHHIRRQGSVRKPGHRGPGLFHQVNVLAEPVRRQRAARDPVIRHPVEARQSDRFPVQQELVTGQLDLPQAKPVFYHMYHLSARLQGNAAGVKFRVVEMPEFHRGTVDLQIEHQRWG